MPKPDRPVPMLTDEEEARVQLGIANDPDNPEWTDKDFARAKPASEALPPALYAALTRGRGRPKVEAPKLSVTLRISPDVVDWYKAGGRGWQTRMNDALVAGMATARTASTAVRTERAREVAPTAGASRKRDAAASPAPGKTPSNKRA